MKTSNPETFYSSDKCEIILEHSDDGKIYAKKNKPINPEVAELLKNLNSPYISRLIENNEISLTYEYAEGKPLNETRITPDMVYNVFHELCDGLSALHTAGIIHRDIKPSNIILCNDGHIKIIDFDAARIKKPTADKDTTYLGTDGFAPPEQFGFSQTDERSDIYALGVTMQLILGENYQHSKYKRIIEKCIRFNPEQRYGSVKEVKKALTRNRLSPIFIGISALLVIAVTAVTVIMGLQNEKPSADSSSAQSDIDTTPSTTASTGTPTSISTTTASNTPIIEEATTPATTSNTETTTVTTPEATSKPAETTTVATTPTSTSTTSTTTTQTTPTTSVEVVPEEADLSYPWETLVLPVDFPQLSDTVDSYYTTMGYLEIIWYDTTIEQSREIALKASEWAGGELEHNSIEYQTYWKSIDSPHMMSVICYYEPQINSYYTKLDCYYYFNDIGQIEFAHTKIDYSEADNISDSQRNIAWDSLNIPSEIPKLSEAITAFTDQSQLEDTDEASYYDYIFEWDTMSHIEAAYIAEKLHTLAPTEVNVTYEYGSAYYTFISDKYYISFTRITDDLVDGNQSWVGIIIL